MPREHTSRIATEKIRVLVDDMGAALKKKATPHSRLLRDVINLIFMAGKKAVPESERKGYM